ncbi:MAG: HAD family hydrolase [Promethearchaeota archaeon]
MEIKGVFFDFFGTLFISDNEKTAWSNWLSSFYEYLFSKGLSESKETFSTLCNGFMGRDEPPLKNNGLTIYERRIKVFCEELGLSSNLNLSDIRNITDSTINAFESDFYLDPEVIPLLKTLKKNKKNKKNKKLALITNYDHFPRINYLLSKLGIKKYFDSITISSKIGIKKPNPQIFKPALEKTDLQPKECVYVGDSGVDIQGSLSAGITPILIQRDNTKPIHDEMNYDGTDKKKPTNYLIRNFKKVKKIEKLSDLIELI